MWVATVRWRSFQSSPSAADRLHQLTLPDHNRKVRPLQKCLNWSQLSGDPFVFQLCPFKKKKKEGKPNEKHNPFPSSGPSHWGTFLTWHSRIYNVLFGLKKQCAAEVFSLSAAKLVELELVHITKLSPISASMCQRHGSNYEANRKHPKAQFEIKPAELDATGLKYHFIFYSFKGLSFHVFFMVKERSQWHCTLCGGSDCLAYLPQLCHKRVASISCMRPFMGSDNEKSGRADPRATLLVSAARQRTKGECQSDGGSARPPFLLSEWRGYLRTEPVGPIHYWANKASAAPPVKSKSACLTLQRTGRKSK